MTVATLREFGILIEETENTYIIKGNQKYISPKEITIEGDWSNSAFFLCAGALSKDGVTVSGLDIRQKAVTYIVGTVYDHVLHLGGENIVLNELCGKNAEITLKIRAPLFG